MGVRSGIGVQNGKKILFGADKGLSHKTSRSLIRGSLVAGTTVFISMCVFAIEQPQAVSTGCLE